MTPLSLVLTHSFIPHNFSLFLIIILDSIFTIALSIF
uniref:Uncharacterized protein n=1 Tax=Lepeophtheirus salmonis TaxID=72036 RepID=A0A0K2V619_LEPSM